MREVCRRVYRSMESGPGMRSAAAGRSPAVGTSRMGNVSLRREKVDSERPLRPADDTSFDKCEARSQISGHIPACIQSSLQTRLGKHPDRMMPTDRG